ncbi:MULTISPECIES: hypothetical protein [unclassified Streptomyces]|uniref:hypothetical protein n=1 Tax=unclassified Streptomyces TaxID=2593676 RepID=UPI0029BC73FD|nr:hypothetical protein [Streptomyces sp. DK15]MDX2389138.1 hypothetical protein [Streptomyces sp. DK15]
MHFSRARARSMTIVFAAGTALGVLGPLTAKFDNPVCQAATLVFSSGWAWACFAFLVGFSRRSRIEATVLASSSLAMAVVVYYVFKFVFPAAVAGVSGDSGSGENPISQILAWGAAAFILGAPVGLFGNIARTPGIAGIPFRLLIPLAAFYETSVRLETEAPSLGSDVTITWQVIRLVAVAAFVAVPVHGLMAWRSRRSRRNQWDRQDQQDQRDRQHASVVPARRRPAP